LWFIYCISISNHVSTPEYRYHICSFSSFKDKYIWKINLANHSNFAESSIYTHLTWASKHAICCSKSRLSNSVSFLCPCSKHKIRTNSQNHNISYNRVVTFSFTIKSHSRKKTKNWEQLTSSLSETSVFALSNSSFKIRQFVR